MDNKELYLKWQKDNNFSMDKDRLKEKLYLFSSIPNANSYGFQNGKIREIMYADVLLKYQRLQNKNVLFPLGFNTLCQSAFIEQRKSNNVLNDDIANIYLRQMLKLGIGVNQSKLMNMRHDEYLSNLQLDFIELYKKGYIDYKMTNVYFDKSNNKIYDLGLDLDKEIIQMKCFVLKLDNVIDKVINNINKLKINENKKEELLSFFKPKSILSIDAYTSNNVSLRISLERPELLGGVSFIFLNPDYIDVLKYTDQSEYDTVSNYLENKEGLFVYSGTIAKNPLTGGNIPIFISYFYQTEAYLGVPGADPEDLEMAKNEGFEEIKIFDEENNLINSDFIDGLDSITAREKITNAFVEYEIGTLITKYEHTEILLHQLDPFGGLFPFLDDRGKLYSLEDYLPYNFSEQFRPVLSKEIKIPGQTITGTMNSMFSIGMAPFIGILYDEMSVNESIFSKEAYNEFNEYFPIKLITIDNENIINELLMPLVINTIIQNENSNIPCIYDDVRIISKTVDIKHNTIKRSNNNLIDFDKLVDRFNPDAIRFLSLKDECNQEFIFDIYQLEDYSNLINDIYALFESFSSDSKVRFSFYEFSKKCDNYLKNNDVKLYIDLVDNFTNKIKNESISKDEGLIYLICCYPIFTFTAEDLYIKKYNGKYSIINESWPS